MRHTRFGEVELGLVRANSVNPNEVIVPRYYGRHPARLADTDFLSLRKSIEEHGGNVAPIVLALEDDCLHLVLGRRRLEACRQLGISIHAVENAAVATPTAIEMMLRDAHHNWSLFELGTTIQQAISLLMFASARRLAFQCGLDLRLVNAALRLRELPAVVLAVFRDPTQLDGRMAARLAHAFELDPQRVLQRSCTANPSASASKNVAHLCG